MAEPIAIMNPSRKHYKFLFRADEADDAMDFILGWIGGFGWTLKRDKHYLFPQSRLVEVRVWLN